MSKILALFIMLISLTSCSTINYSFKSTARIEIFPAGVCSATYIDSNLVLTSKHCIDDSINEISISGKFAKILKRVNDSTDHLILLVDIASDYYSEISSFNPKIGDKIYFYGNVSGLNQVYREGYVASLDEKGMILLDVNGWKGDSGAGVFNKHAFIIGTVNYVIGDPVGNFRLVAINRWSFNEKDIKELGYDCFVLPICKN